MSTRQDKFLEETRKFVTGRLNEAVGDFYDALVTDFKKTTSMLPEEHFVYHFLPYFSGQKKIEKGSTVLSDWFSIAGSHTSEVAIIDGKTGDTLFVVPPVAPRSRINTAYNTQRSHASLEDIGAISEQLQQTISERGFRFMAEQHANRLKVLLDKDNPVAKEVMSETDKDILRWNAIFERYGIIPKTGVAKEEQKVSAADKARQELDDDMTF